MIKLVATLITLLMMAPVAAVNFNSPFTTDQYTLGLWHFDESAGATATQDASGNDNNGTLVTGFTNELDPNSTWVAGMPGFGNCASVGGGNDGVIKIPQSDQSLSVTTNDDLTIEFWMYPTTTNFGVICRKYTGGDYNVEYYQSKMRYGWYSNGWELVTDTTTIPTNTWTHVAVTVDRTSDPSNDTITFFINGELSTTHITPLTGGNPNSYPLWIMSIDGASTSYQFSGKLDELRISNILRDYTGDPGIPTVNFSATESSTNEENEETVNIQISLDMPSDSTVTVPYTVSGTAENGIDYTGPTPASPITFKAGETVKNIQVSIIDDVYIDGGESILLTLGTPVNANPGFTLVHTLSIVDDDHNRPVALFGSTYSAIDEDIGTVEVEVLLSRATSQTVTLPYTLTGVAQNGGVDYSIAPISQVVFAPFETSKTIQVSVNDDGDVEETEAVVMTLVNPVNASIGKVSVHRIAIIDNDGESGAPAQWLDTFYPFRVPITTNVPSPGEYKLDLTPQMVTDWMNEKADFRFKRYSFVWDSVNLVEIDGLGAVIDEDVDAGFMIKLGAEKIINGDFESGTSGWNIGSSSFVWEESGSYDGSAYMTVTSGADRLSVSQNFVPVEDTWFKFSCWSHNDAAIDILITRQPPLASGSWQPLEHTFVDPYSPLDEWKKEEYYFYTDKWNWTSSDVSIRLERFAPAAIDDVSVIECETEFVLNATSAGTKRYMLYYSPTEGLTQNEPTRQKQTAFPSTALTVTKDGETEWLEEGVAYSLNSNSVADVWYASTMRKILTDATPPSATRSEITISCARNESEAIQIIVSPKASGQVTSVNATLTGPGSYILDADDMEIRHAKYVPIVTPSTTGIYYLEADRAEFSGDLPDPLPEFEPVSFSASDDNVLIWLDIKVPMGAPAGTYNGTIRLATSAGNVDLPVKLTVWDFALPNTPSFRSGLQTTAPFMGTLPQWHKVTDPMEKYELVRRYNSELAKYKLSAFFPFGSYIIYPGTLPPSPADRWFDLEWVLDEIFCSAYCIEKSSGLGMGAWTQAQFDAEADEWEPHAEYLYNNGWIDEEYYGFDEPRPEDYIGVKQMIDTFRAKGYSGMMKFFAYVYHGEVWDEMRSYIDIFTPIMNENFGNSISPIGSAIQDPSTEVWTYWTNTAHIWIDAPGISQRLMAPKIRAYGGMGVGCWSILNWFDSSHGYDNPWVNPYSSWGNGQGSYFYPPSPLGLAIPAKDERVVPSLRLVLHRDGIEDFEYAEIIELLIEEAESVGVNTGDAVAAMAKWNGQMRTPSAWRLGEVYWKETRQEMAQAIEGLRTPDITQISLDTLADTITISWKALPSLNYKLYYSEELGSGQQWIPAVGAYTITDGTAVQVVNMGNDTKRFYKVSSW
jgi:Concanavalin A-like lectin/glucanases superfamily/Calx-beta domain